MNIGYFDIHTHILPNVDDGSGDMEETMQMLEKEYEEGVRTVIMTPHYVPGKSDRKTELVKKIFGQVRVEVEKKYQDMELYLGNELYYRQGILEALEEGRANTLAGSRYVLVEFDIHTEAKKLYDSMFKMQSRGYKPILAHAERYVCLYNDEKLLGELVKAGVAIQINADSFQGGIFDKTSKFCMRAVKNGWVHFLGSDCHNTTTRPPSMRKTAERLEKKFGKEIAERILYQNPQRLLEDKYI